MLIIRRVLLTIMLLLAIVYAGAIAYAYWPAADGLPAKELARAGDQFVDVDGLAIRYRTWGEQRAGEPAIVLMHGFANSVQTFRELGPELAEDYYVIALDMPGFGLSSKPDDRDYSNTSQAYLVERFIEALELDSVVIGGHSMGGALAVHVAIDSPRVMGAIMLNPGLLTTGVPAATEYLVFPLPRISAKTFADRAFRERFLKTAYINPDIITPQVMEEVMLGTQTDDYMTGVTQLMGYYVAGDEEGMLQDIEVPVLIVWGAEDRGKPKGEAEQLNSMIPVSRLVLVEGVGHYVHEEAAPQSAAAIIEAKDYWLTAR